MHGKKRKSRIGTMRGALPKRRRSFRKNLRLRSSSKLDDDDMKKFDAVIAGGGVIGGAIALELVRVGLRVAVFDRQQPGQEASWASAGILSPAPESPGMVTMVPLGKASLSLYPEFIAQVEEISGKSTGFRPKGTLEALFSHD